MEVIDQIASWWSSLWDSDISTPILIIVLLIVVIPLFLLFFTIALLPGLLLDILGDYLKRRFPKQAESSTLRAWFSILGVGIFISWIVFLSFLLEQL